MVWTSNLFYGPITPGEWRSGPEPAFPSDNDFVPMHDYENVVTD